MTPMAKKLKTDLSCQLPEFKAWWGRDLFLESASVGIQRWEK